jgi:hypothetical protein
MSDLDHEEKIIRRPTIDFDLMVCIIQSICEVLRINIPITAGDPADMAEMIEIISGKIIAPTTDLHQMSLFLSEIITDKCKDPKEREMILNLSAKKYVDFILKDQFVFVS